MTARMLAAFGFRLVASVINSIPTSVCGGARAGPHGSALRRACGLAQLHTFQVAPIFELDSGEAVDVVLSWTLGGKL